MKKGDVCYNVVWDRTKIEYWTYVLRTIRKGRGYWWPKFPGITWGKLSTKHFDYGWLPDAPPEFRTMQLITNGRPYAATKLGALRAEIADVRADIKSFGEDFREWDDEPTAGVKLKKLLAAQKRMRGKK